MQKPPPRYASLREFVNAHPRTMTQGEIAKKIGLHQGTLSSYLVRNTAPGREVALRLSREFNISLEGLLDPPPVEEEERSA